MEVRQEVRRRSAPNILVQGPVDEKNRVYFTGENNENPIEILLACESEMARVGSRLEDQDKIPVSYTHLDVYKRQSMDTCLTKLKLK